MTCRAQICPICNSMLIAVFFFFFFGQYISNWDMFDKRQRSPFWRGVRQYDFFPYAVIRGPTPFSSTLIHSPLRNQVIQHHLILQIIT